MHADPQHRHRRALQQCCSGERGHEAHPGAARPGDHRAPCKLRTRRRRPDPQVIFGNRDARLGKRLARSRPIQPCRGDEAGDRLAGDVLDDALSVGDTASTPRRAKDRGTRLRRRSSVARETGRRCVRGAARRGDNIRAGKSRGQRRPSRAAASRRASRERSAPHPNGWARPAGQSRPRRGAATGRAAPRSRFQSAGIRHGSTRATGVGWPCPCTCSARARSASHFGGPLTKLHLSLMLSGGWCRGDADRRCLRFLCALWRWRPDLCRCEAAQRRPVRPRDHRHRPRQAPRDRPARPRRGPGHHSVADPPGRSPLPLFQRRARASCASSTHGGRTMSKPPRHGRARRWSAAGKAMRAARWSCIPTRSRLMPIAGSAALLRSRRSTAGSAGSGATCAVSGACTMSSSAPTRSCPSGFERAASATARPCRWASKPGCFRRGSARRISARPRWRASGSIRRRCCWSASAAFPREKRWDMVMRAVGECARRHPVGLLLVGDGRKRQTLELLAARLPSRRGHAADLAIATSWRDCWRARTHWSTAAKRRPSAWSLPRRARAECR